MRREVGYRQVTRGGDRLGERAGSLQGLGQVLVRGGRRCQCLISKKELVVCFPLMDSAQWEKDQADGNC